ncbi:MAG: hypothetical protein LLG20_19720 [Acidobacteriales bacterium]|nr:hypothetical protein [Terriglobales bacterium]
MADVLTRREFVGAVSSALAATPGCAVEPYFPSAAHQLVWRNWDLAPAERIAEALGATRSNVQAQARSLGLGRQSVDDRFARRLRFKTLCRNWDFVPMEQLSVLARMSESEITELLAHDAFYAGHLGPKPDCSKVRMAAGSAGSAVPEHFRIALHGPEQPRYGFLDELARPAARNPWAGAGGEAALAPRIAFPYTALFGDILNEEDFEAYYPAGVLENMARLGLSSIWLHAVLRDLVRTDVFGEIGTGLDARMRRLNWLIAEAARYGLTVYLYLNEPRGMPAGFFSKHPEIKGASGRPGDGLWSMCTSTAPVKKYLEQAAAALFRAAPKLAGTFLITISENPTNCYSVAKEPECPRCRTRRPQEVVGEVVSLVEKGARSVKPDAHIVAWDWSWNFHEADPQAEFIAALPPTVTLMVDFERGTPIVREGVRTVVDEYSLSVTGPSPRAAAHLRLARERGMKTMVKAQVGTTWEMSLVPYIPVPELVARKFSAIRSAGADGVVASWTLGTYPSPNWSAAQAFYRGDAPGVEETVARVAADLYGKGGKAEALQAWKVFAEAFSDYPFTNGLVYSSVVQWGPAHPWWPQRTGKRPRILHSYDSLSWTSPFGPEIVVQVFERMSARWHSGIEHLSAACKLAPAAARADVASDLRVSRAVGLYFESIANFVRFHSTRERGGGSVKELLRKEIRLATGFLDIVRADARFGYEPSIQYFYLPLDIREKIAACRYYLGKA